MMLGNRYLMSNKKPAQQGIRRPLLAGSFILNLAVAINYGKDILLWGD